MSFLKKIWPQCCQSPGGRSCQDVPTGSSMAVPVVVPDPSHSRLLPWAGCRSPWVTAPRKHFSYQDASVHCLWVYISCLSWVQAWWSQILPKPTETMEKRGWAVTPMSWQLIPQKAASWLFDSSASSFDWAASLYVDNEKAEKAI